MPMLASFFGPRVANATPFDSTDALVAQGFQIFFNEKFGIGAEVGNQIEPVHGGQH